MRTSKGQNKWMALKVNLEKAYNHIRWDFIKDSLMEVGILQDLITTIMHYITTFLACISYEMGLFSNLSP